MELARIHSQLQGSSARPNHFLDAETCEFPSLSMLPVWDRGPYTICKLCAKYQLCAIRTADNTDGKSRKSIVSEKSPSFRLPCYLVQIGAYVPTRHLIFLATETPSE